MKVTDITRVVVMDFDGTLMDTMTPDKGKDIWRKSTGFDWPHKGWWGREESLDVVVFGCNPIPSVISAYNQESGDTSTWMVMMTGRIPKLQNQVRNMLDQHSLTFDEYLYNTGGPTLDFKINKLNSFLQRFPALESIAIFEDRPEHTQAFRQWGESVNIQVEVTQV
jgi:hypothetical protein